MRIDGNGAGAAVGGGKPPQCQGCPLATRGHHFIPGSVGGKSLWEDDQRTDIDFSGVRIGVCGSSATFDDVGSGRPFCGQAGRIFRGWILPNAGVEADEILMDNVIRCIPPQGIGTKELRAAADHCRRYDRWDEMGVTTDVITYDPLKLMKDPVPLPLVIADVGKARKMFAAGKVVRILLGEQAVVKWHAWAQSVSRWRGHYVEVRSELDPFKAMLTEFAEPKLDLRMEE